jgi:serine-type D-Ala-D-Ala carboxypeptidase (penicillin-binding protein 5/6)
MVLRLPSVSRVSRSFRLGAVILVAALVGLFPSVAWSFTPSSPVAPSISAGAALVMDAGSGEVLLERRADERRAMASTTKIMTAVVALDHVPAEQLDQPFTVGRMRIRWGQTVMGLRTGDRVTVRELLYGMMLPSGNDAADTLAERVAGSRERFVELMNVTAGLIGLRDTHFANPSGLDHAEHYTTARDLAVLARHAMQYRVFAEIVGQRTYTVADPWDQGVRELVNLNVPLFFYPGVTGVKPGWTPQAGVCQVVSVTLDGRSVIAILLNTDSGDMTRLLDWLYGTRSVPAGERFAHSRVFGRGDDGEPWTYYGATGRRVRAGFLRFFEGLGGASVLGYPLSEELQEDGRVVQYFQRARLEWHPEMAGTSYEVQISLLGERIAAQRKLLPQPAVEPFESWRTNRYFPETGHSVHSAFLRYFERMGGVDVFGFPISEELASDVDWVHPVQYFQRGRLQYHAERAGTAGEVSAALVGEWAYVERHNLASPAMPVTHAMSATPVPQWFPTPAPSMPPLEGVAADDPVAPLTRLPAPTDRADSAGNTGNSVSDYAWSPSLVDRLRDLLRRIM